MPKFLETISGCYCGSRWCSHSPYQTQTHWTWATNVMFQLNQLWEMNWCILVRGGLWPMRKIGFTLFWELGLVTRNPPHRVVASPFRATNACKWSRLDDKNCQYCSCKYLIHWEFRNLCHISTHSEFELSCNFHQTKIFDKKILMNHSVKLI